MVYSLHVWSRCNTAEEYISVGRPCQDTDVKGTCFASWLAEESTQYNHCDAIPLTETGFKVRNPVTRGHLGLLSVSAGLRPISQIRRDMTAIIGSKDAIVE